MIVADASWIIALRDPEDVHHADASILNDQIKFENVILHQVTLAECLVAPAKLVYSTKQCSLFEPPSTSRHLPPTLSIAWQTPNWSSNADYLKL